MKEKCKNNNGISPHATPLLLAAVDILEYYKKKTIPACSS
jgi:hypothetical protein